MDLTNITLTAVALLSLCSGIIVLGGTRRHERPSALLFFVITLFASFWAASIGIFLSLPETTSPTIAKVCTYLIYLPAIFMSWGLAAYPTYKYPIGKYIMIFFAIYGAGIFIAPLLDSSLLFTGIRLSEDTGNIVFLTHNLYNILYMTYFVATCLVYMVAFFYGAHHTKNPSIKRANYINLIGFTITGIFGLTFDVVLSYMGKYDTIWIGPFVMSLCWLLHYYSILRYRLLDVANSWLKLFSHTVIVSLCVIIYSSIFYLIFTILFNGLHPSNSVIILVALMILIVLSLFPALNEFSSYIHSLAATNEVDLVYLVKKLVILSKSKLNYDELASFLTEHLHFQYVGILIDNQLYDSKRVNIKLTTAQLNQIQKLKNPNQDIWLSLTPELKTELKSLNIEAIAELRNTRSEVVGRILLGYPQGGISFNSRNRAELETALSLIATILSLEKRSV